MYMHWQCDFKNCTKLFLRAPNRLGPVLSEKDNLWMGAYVVLKPVSTQLAK